MKKIRKMDEPAWFFGTIICALGIALCTKASFGISMIVAPSYTLHLWLREIWPWFTQGTAEYVWQAFLLVVLCVIIKRFKLSYLLSFVAAMFSGIAIDAWLWVLGGNGPYEDIWIRIVAFVIGELLSTFGVALLFRTTMPVQMYELIVKEIARCFSFRVERVKMVHDYIMLGLSFVMPLILVGGLGGFGIGTVFITVINAPIIAMQCKIVDSLFEFDSMFDRKNAKKLNKKEKNSKKLLTYVF